MYIIAENVNEVALFDSIPAEASTFYIDIYYKSIDKKRRHRHQNSYPLYYPWYQQHSPAYSNQIVPSINTTFNQRFNCTQFAPCAYITHYFICTEICIFFFGVLIMYLLCSICNFRYSKKEKSQKKIKTVIGKIAIDIEEKTHKLEESV